MILKGNLKKKKKRKRKKAELSSQYNILAGRFQFRQTCLTSFGQPGTRLQDNVTYQKALKHNLVSWSSGIALTIKVLLLQSEFRHKDNDTDHDGWNEIWKYQQYMILWL